MSNKYDCILYDFDGTLADTVPLIIQSFEEAYTEVLGRCDRSREDLLKYIGLPLMASFERHDEETANKLFDAYLRINCAHLANNEVDLFDGVLDELKRLKKLGVKQGIVTSKRRDSLMVTIELMGLEKFFDVFVVKDDTQKHKPDPEPIYYASEKLGIPTNRILYVGDAIGDIKCAINSGCDSAFVSWSVMPKDEIMALEPTYVLKEIEDLSCIINSQEL